MSAVKYDGSGITVGIVDPYGDVNDHGSDLVQSDLQKFCSKFGLPYESPTMGASATLTEVGNTSKAPVANWPWEVALDVEWVHAIAPGAKILLVLARSDDADPLFDGVVYASEHSSVVLTCWGDDEFRAEAAVDKRCFDRPGVCYIASTGDDGTSINYPAVSPYVTAIGGTRLTGPTGQRVDEVGWNGSCGGVSHYESASYQSEWAGGSFRDIPDVSADAALESAVAVYQDGWHEIFGTSVSASIWAGVIARVDGGLGGGLDTKKLNILLYCLGSRAMLDGNFFDVIKGHNGRYQARKGYDLVTGLGTPRCKALIPNLIALAKEYRGSPLLSRLRRRRSGALK